MEDDVTPLPQYADNGVLRRVSEQTIKLDKINPQVAARLAGAFGQWRRYEPATPNPNPNALTLTLTLKP